MSHEITIFLKRLGWFVLIPALGIMLSIPVLDFLNKTKLNGYRVKPGTEILLAGDSHISTSLDDRIIPHSVNMALPAEPYYLTFFKLRAVLQTNPGIRKVILGFSYHNLSAYLDSNLYGKKGEAITANYFLMLPHSDQWMLVRNFSGNLGPYFKEVLKSGSKNALKPAGRQSFSGQFDNVFTSSHAVDSSMAKRVRYQYYSEGSLAGFSELNMAWLDSIVGLCKTQEVELIFLNTPMHARYRSDIPAPFQKRYHDMLERYGLPVIDLEADTMEDDRYTPDGDHLSAKGAREISTAFPKTLMRVR